MYLGQSFFNKSAEQIRDSTNTFSQAQKSSPSHSEEVIACTELIPTSPATTCPSLNSQPNTFQYPTNTNFSSKQLNLFNPSELLKFYLTVLGQPDWECDLHCGNTFRKDKSVLETHFSLLNYFAEQ